MELSACNRTMRRLFCFLCFSYNFLLDNNIQKVDTFNTLNLTSAGSAVSAGS